MPVKTITIDLEAYNLLAAAKKGNESFSKVTKRRFRPTCTAASLLEKLPKIVLSAETLDALDDLVARRRDSVAESPLVELGE